MYKLLPIFLIFMSLTAPLFSWAQASDNEIGSPQEKVPPPLILTINWDDPNMRALLSSDKTPLAKPNEPRLPDLGSAITDDLTKSMIDDSGVAFLQKVTQKVYDPKALLTSMSNPPLLQLQNSLKQILRRTCDDTHQSCPLNQDEGVLTPFADWRIYSQSDSQLTLDSETGFKAHYILKGEILTPGTVPILYQVQVHENLNRVDTPAETSLTLTQKISGPISVEQQVTNTPHGRRTLSLTAHIQF